MFFVATVDPDRADGPLGEGPVNLSPKGDSRLVVLDNKTVAYVDFVGSGNQTARHIASGSPISVMVCSFEEKNAGIVRLYGHGRTFNADSYPNAEKLKASIVGEMALPERQVIEIAVEKTITSCGYGVPVSEGFKPRTTQNRGRAYK